MMKKMLLTSNGFYTEQIKKEFISLIDRDISKCKVTIITTASFQKENNRFVQKAKADFLQMGFQNIQFTDVEFDQPELLFQYDVIYISGGNPFYLLFHLKKSGADFVLKKLALQGTIIVGVSAGALVLGPNIDVVNAFTPNMNIYAMNELTALEMTDALIFPHYDREDLFQDPAKKSIEERLKEFESHNHCEVKRIRESEYLLIKS
jgi:dipeptidase E